MYLVGGSARDVWGQVDQAYGGRGDLHAQGWRAKRVRIEEIGS
jgi:hypothetical protein